MNAACAPGTSARSRITAARPRAALRQASTTEAPRRASSRAVTYPIPLLAPVTTALRPLWSGMCAAFQPGMAAPS